MKRIILLFVISLVFPFSAIAQTKTPTNTIPSRDQLEKINDKVDELKDKVASRVAQLKLVERRGIIGAVESVSDTQITLTDLNEKRRIIDVDEFTKFSSGESDSFGISDIKKGSKISAIGLYNKESQRLLARFINEISIPLFLHGVITEKNDDEFTITLLTEDGTSYLVDVERITKTFAYSDGQLETSGFTKINTLENALVIGIPVEDEENRITASRVVVLPNLPKNPKIKVSEESTSPTPAEEASE